MGCGVQHRQELGLRGAGEGIDRPGVMEIWLGL